MKNGRGKPRPKASDDHGEAWAKDEPSGKFVKQKSKSSLPKKVGRKHKPPAEDSLLANETAAVEHTGPAVVGLGASAGGLMAFKDFFSTLPPATGMAFVLVQHLDPTHESLTASILSRHTAMPVVQVEDGMPVEANHVYVIPPDKYLTISHGTLHLSTPPERRGIRLPVDFFFRSLAQDRAHRAIGVVLTGTGSDGTLGAREIKAAGGMVMAQAPQTAQYQGMPQSIIAAGLADFVLPVGEMPAQLVRYIEHGYVTGKISPKDSDDKAADVVEAIVALLHSRSKFNFSGYKRGTLVRRIQRRMSLRHIESMDDYLQVLRQEADEWRLLSTDLLIKVTNFFRDPETWNDLTENVLKPLIQKRNPTTPLRAWVAGCATGEEAYSLAMLLVEACQDAERGCDINIFASDVDPDALAFARAGIYPENILAHVPAEKLRRFFIRGDHTYRINKDIRDAVVFARHNLISDPPFSKLDIITCRNLLIYLEPEVQKKILNLFHFALRQGGFLFLGNAETIGNLDDLFEPVSRRSRIYRRIGPVRRESLELPMHTMAKPHPYAPPPPLPEEGQARRLAALGQQVLTQRFAPASVLINRKAQVVYLHGPVDDYLRLPSGEMGQDLIAMARQGLKSVLRSAVQQAMQTSKPVVVPKVRIKRGHSVTVAQVVVEPLRDPGAEGLLLVSFTPAGVDPKSTRVVYIESPEPEPLENPSTPAEYEAVIRHLENELARGRAEQQETITELATRSEEFKTANEEVTSINEELQSTNEELETSKEELQSMNEELQTVNSQLESKLNELEASTNDFSNLLMSIDYATLFLDSEFRIKQFTPAATRLLRIIKSDLGRPVSDFTRNVSDPNLLPDAKAVLTNLAPVEREITNDDGRIYLRRIVPYRTEERRIGGVVITFTDITQAKQDFLAIHESQHRFTSFMKHLPGLAWIKDLQGHYVYANEAALAAYGRSDAALYGRTDEELFTPQAAALYRKDDQEAMASSAGIQVIEELAHADGTTRQSIVSKFTIRDVQGKPAYIAGMAMDITDHVKTRDELRRAREHLQMVTDSMAIGVAQCNRQFEYVWVNAAYAQRLKRPSEEIVGRTLTQVLGEEAFQVIRPFCERAMAGERVSYEREVGFETLGRRWIHADYAPTYDASKVVDGWVAVVKDITEEKKAERALRESEARKSAVLNASLDAIITIDNHGRIMDWNPAAEQIFGLSREQAVGEDAARLLLPPALHDQCREDMAKVLSTGEGPALGKRMETTVRRADGTEFTAEVALSRIAMDGPPVFEGFVRDITERKVAEKALQLSEERLRLAAQATGFGTCDYDVRSDHRTWSPELCEILGVAETAPASTALLLNLVHPDDRSRVAAFLEQTLDPAGPDKQELEYRIVRPDGDTRWVRDASRTHFEAEGEERHAVRVVGTMQDITERKRIDLKLHELTVSLEQQVADRTRRLRDATAKLLTTEEAERRRLAKDLHDSLCQDLVVVKMKLGELEQALQHGDLTLAHKANEGAVHMVDQASRSSRLMVGQLSPPALHDAGLNAAITRLAAQMRDNYNLKVDLSEITPSVTVEDEETRVIIYRSVRELLINAAKYAGVHEAAVGMKQTPDRLVVSVSDEGNGFDPAKTREGFGLFMTRERIENMGGTMAVESVPHEFTRITLTIPLGDEANIAPAGNA